MSYPLYYALDTQLTSRRILEDLIQQANDWKTHGNLTALVEYKSVKDYLCDVLVRDPQPRLRSLLRPKNAQSGSHHSSDTEKYYKKLVDLDEIGLRALSTIVLQDEAKSPTAFFKQKDNKARSLLNLLRDVSVYTSAVVFLM